MNDFQTFRNNAENCQQLSEAAKDEASAKRFHRMAEAWLALANEQDWLDGKLDRPVRHSTCEAKKTARDNPRAVPAVLKAPDPRGYLSQNGSAFDL